MSILARVTMRSNSKKILGSINLTRSFVVVDVRRYDQPSVILPAYGV